jgi:hypothetical protein
MEAYNAKLYLHKFLITICGVTQPVTSVTNFPASSLDTNSLEMRLS